MLSFFLCVLIRFALIACLQHVNYQGLSWYLVKEWFDCESEILQITQKFGNKLDLQISKLYCITHTPRISKKEHHKSPIYDLQYRFIFLTVKAKTLQKAYITQKLPIT